LVKKEILALKKISCSSHLMKKTDKLPMKTSIAMICLCTLTIFVGCASGPDRGAIIEQHVTDVENRISTLEAQSQKKNESMVGDEQSLRDRFAGMRAELDSLTNEIQTLSGRLDEIEHKIEQRPPQEMNQERTTGDVGAYGDRIARLEQYLKLETGGKIPVQAPNNQQTPPVQPVRPVQSEVSALSEEQLYAVAKQAFDRQDMEGARLNFEEFVKKYPKSENADNAQFWIGEIYYRQKWYEKAILEYQKVIEKYPKGNKTQAALLKQGLSFLNLGDKANARLILNEVVKKHPGSAEAELAAAKLKEL
jgi:tol-pal system protein YbgF